MHAVFVHEDAVPTLSSLPSTQQHKLMDWKERLANDPMVGQQLQKARIPRRMQRRYDLTNLWRLPLPDGWRLLYTILALEQQNAVLILWIGTHTEYNRLLGYT